MRDFFINAFFHLELYFFSNFFTCVFFFGAIYDSSPSVKSHKFCNNYTILFLVFLAPFWWGSLFSLWFWVFSWTNAQEILLWCAFQGKGYLCLSTGWKLFSLCGFWKMFVGKTELKIQPNPQWYISSPFLSAFLNQDFALSVNIPLKRAAWMASTS